MKKRLKELKAETFDLIIRRDALRHEFKKLNGFINENIENIIILTHKIEATKKDQKIGRGV